MKHRSTKRGESGSALMAAVIAVLVCGALSASVLATNMGRRHEADSEFSRERALELADSGVDWAVAQVRKGVGAIPAGPVPDVHGVRSAGSFSIRYAPGAANGNDDDGDGIVDEADESGYLTIRSTGESGGVRRTVEVLLRKAVDVPQFGSIVQFNVATPIFDLNGNAYTVSGAEHLIDGTVDPMGASKYGISSPATATDLISQIPSGQIGQITGLGAAPSVGTVPTMNLSVVMQQAQAAASMILAPGTHTDVHLGTATSAYAQVVYCNGDLHLSGNGTGAGVLAVDGDLDISGDFTWTGMILVRGRVTMTGGGGTKRLVGALCASEEVSDTSGSTTVGLAGTVDLLYSSAAVALAADRLSVMAVVSWREVANP